MSPESLAAACGFVVGATASFAFCVGVLVYASRRWREQGCLGMAVKVPGTSSKSHTCRIVPFPWESSDPTAHHV